MKNIVLLMKDSLRKTIFDAKTLKRLEDFGNVYINDCDQDPDSDRVKRLIKDAHIIITSWGCPTLDKYILDSAPNVELVAHAAGTVKGIVSDSLWDRGIRVTGSAKAIGIGVAETALGFTIASLKNMWRLSKNTREGEWALGKEDVREVYDVNIGVIGAGRAGRHYIELIKNFDVNILLYDPTIDDNTANKMGVKKVELEKIFKESDVLSIHAPSIPETDHMVNANTLAMMKDDAIIINTARGSIIDEDALIIELKKGRLFACIDVTDPEPPSKDHPFRTLPNVILTPHIAGAVNNGLYRIGNYVAEEIALYEAGEDMDGEILREELESLA